MKRVVLIAAIAGITLAGCKNDKDPEPKSELSVNTEELTFTDAGETKTFAVMSNTSWSLAGHETQTWITNVSPKAGNGNAVVSVTVAANTTIGLRQAELTLTSQGVSPVTVTVIQGGQAPELSVNTNVLTFPSEGETVTFDVTANTAWTLTGHETVTWITDVSPTSGNGNAKVSVTTAANTATEDLEAELTLTAQDVTPVTVTVILYASALLPEITSFSPASAGYGETVTVTGVNFSEVQDENAVKFNGIEAEIVSATATEITVIVPKNLNCGGKISVTTRGQTAESDAVFTYQPTNTVSTLAGDGTSGDANGVGEAAKFNWPYGAAIDAVGNIYVADNNNRRIRKITPAGEVSTFAGSGATGYLNGAADVAQFNVITGVAFDASGNLYVTDYGNHRIRKITPAGEVSTFAGTGTAGFADGAADVAQFNNPSDVAVDASGNVYVVEYGGHRIRKITPAGVVSTLAGSGTAGFTDGDGVAAQFRFPFGVAVDAAGNVYVGDRDNHCIRKITPTGTVTTIAGGTQGPNDGTGAAAQFWRPMNLAFDASGNLLVADSYNECIRKVTPAGEVTTFAGTKVQGFANGPVATAQFNHPFGITIDASGTIYVVEEQGRRVRAIKWE